MILYLLQASICMLFFYGFYYLTLRKETMFNTNRIYLIATLVLSLVLPLIKIYVDAKAMQPVMLMTTFVQAESYVSDLTIRSSATAASTFPWLKVISYIYFLGVGILLIRFLAAIFQIREIRSKGTTTVLVGYPCILSDKVKSPFSFFNVIYLPADHRFDDMELAEIMAHESTHAKDGHTWDVLLLEIASMVLWPSPMIYLYKKTLKEVHEYAADAAVIKDSSWENYAQLLVSQQYAQLQNVLSNQLIYSQLKKRLLMMNKQRSGFAARYKYLGILPLLLLALVVFSFRERQLLDFNQSNEQHLINELTTSLDEYLYSGQAEEGIEMFADKTNNLSDQRNGLFPSATHTSFKTTLTGDGRDMPVFPGCKDVAPEEQKSCSSAKLATYISKHLVYPESLKKEGIEGKVVVKFTVSAKGLVEDVSIAVSLHPDADKIVLDLVKAINDEVGKWLPAMKEGKAVAAAMHLPVRFEQDQNTTKETFVQFAEEFPVFPGCGSITIIEERKACSQNKMLEFIYSNIKYPKEDRDNNIEGIGIVQFVVGTDGRIFNIDVRRSPSEGIKQEIIRVMNAMAALPEAWTPAKHDGKAVPLQLTIPVKFVLQPDVPVTEEDQDAEKAVEKQVVVTTLAPNPAKGMITVDLFQGVHTLKIFNASGAQVFMERITESSGSKKTIDISSLPNGSYVVKLNSDTQTSSATFVIINN